MRARKSEYCIDAANRRFWIAFVCCLFNSFRVDDVTEGGFVGEFDRDRDLDLDCDEDEDEDELRLGREEAL